MNSFVEKFVKVCPKTGRIRKFVKPGGIYNTLLPIVGLIALLWILVRVIPKPSRIQYPCMQVATPLASGFLAYFALFAASLMAFIKTKKKVFLSPYFIGASLIIFGFTGTYVANEYKSAVEVVLESSVHQANAPAGEGVGIFPGRVVWVHEPDATNEDCEPNKVGNAWWLPKNNNQVLIDGMISKAIQSLTGTEGDKDAWDEIFKYHNNTRDKGNVNYKAGEKIVIKVNNVSGWGGNFDTKDLSVVANNSYGISETSPHVVLAVLRQLVNVVGVNQTDIYVGDPMRNLYKHCYDMWNSEFPDVHYLSHDNYTKLGREQVVPSSTAKIFYSDKGEVLRENVWDARRPGGDPVTDDYLYTIFDEAEYLLNIPVLKGHKRAGMTMFAKNHFGSHTRSDASHLHNGLIDPIETPNLPGVSRTDYGMYRVQVDIMGHKLLGKKNLVYLLDALWPADQEISFPKKFTMSPFNNDYMSSVFASFDPVAIESVGYDFLRSEFTSTRTLNDGAGTYAQKPAADDYLHQASDPALWPDGIVYDPDGNGNTLKSLGTHEHWNNANDKQYSRNLGIESGIELVHISSESGVGFDHIQQAGFVLNQNYPNPFSSFTNITYSLPEYSKVDIRVYDFSGREVSVIESASKNAGTYTLKFDGSKLPVGNYLYRFTANNYTASRKFSIVK
jgi:hypothetical protein